MATLDLFFLLLFSLDHTTIASGSTDKTIHLWDARTGECNSTIDKHTGYINSVMFSPMNSQLLISASNDHTIQQWGIDGHQVGPECKGEYVAFSSDGTCFVSWGEGASAVIQNSSSGAVITEIKGPGTLFGYCCFSPNSNFVAISSNHTIYIWNISGSAPCLVETFVGHASFIASLAFSSSLIISSGTGPIEFWQIGNLLVDQVSTNSASTPPLSAPIVSVSLDTNSGIAISSDLDGVVRTWDILTGLYKASFQTPPHHMRDVQLVDDRLILVWYTLKEICIWDVEKEELLQTVDIPYEFWAFPPRIYGCKVFLLSDRSIHAWSIWTGEPVGMARLESEENYFPPIMDGSRVWVFSEDLEPQGWNFGIPSSSPTPLSNALLDRAHLGSTNNTRWHNYGPSGIDDVINGKLAFRLSGRYAWPIMVQWDNQYLVAGYSSGEVLIIDFNHTIPQ